MANKRFEVDHGFKLGAPIIEESMGRATTLGNITLTSASQGIK